MLDEFRFGEDDESAAVGSVHGSKGIALNGLGSTSEQVSDWTRATKILDGTVWIGGSDGLCGSHLIPYHHLIIDGSD